MTAVLHVLLFILKCLGILILAVLGLLLLLILLVLLAPIRYRGKVEKKEVPEEVFLADGLLSWLNPFLRVRFRYKEKKFHYTVRLFGVCVRDSDKPKKIKKQKEKKRSKRNKGKAEEVNTEITEVSTETLTNSEYTEEPEETAMPESTAEEFGEEENCNAEGSDDAKKKKTLFSKIKGFCEKIRRVPANIKKKVTEIIDVLKLLWHKKEKTVAFFADELHKTALGKTWDILKQVLHHVLPGKVKGHVEFGARNPETTGKALGILGMLYAWYGKGITVIPDFYEKRIVAEVEFKGRIRCGTLLVKAIRLLRDKQVKRLIDDFKKLLAVLKQKKE